MHIPPHPKGLSPAFTHVIPLSLVEEESKDEGIEGGGGVRVVSSYQHQGQFQKTKKKKHFAFVLFNQ